MSGDARDFNNTETQAVIKFFFPAKQNAEGNSRHSDRTIRGTCTTVCQVKNWVAHFKHGDVSICDAPRPGRLKTVTTPEIIDQIHELILEDRGISTKLIAGQLGISREWVGSIIHDDLDMRKFSAKWVPKCLNADQKHQRFQSSEQLLEGFGAIQMISCRARLVTMDETWLYHYDTETKLTPPRPQKIPSAKIRWKSSRLDFLGSRRHPPL